MRNSLILKLMGAFLLVIAIGATVIAILTSQATQNAFTLYTTRSGQVWAQRFAPALADFYDKTGSWQGVGEFLQTDLSPQIAPGAMGMGAGQGRGLGAGRQNSSGTMAAMGQRLILVDEKGVVVGDTQNKLIGQPIPIDELKSGAAIVVENSMVGTLIITPDDILNANTPAGEFLASVNRALATSVAIAGIIALLLGGVLFLQITSPLRQLKKAATAIASGDLNQRVQIRSRDEFGELGKTFNLMADSLMNAENQRHHLMADVAHELRTPLAAIQGTLEGMQDGVLSLDEEQVTALYSETMLLNRLVSDLRLLSLAEAGHLKLEKQEVDPSDLIQKNVERARPQAAQKKINLEVELQPGLPMVWVDADRITQVLKNLIGNAIQYTPEGGTITVKGSTISGVSLQISVSDTGPGITPQDLPFIFDRFYRADKSRTRSGGGSGLGLAIVKQLVEAHGGSVTAKSPVIQDNGHQYGYGTTFTLTLPELVKN